MNIFIGNIVFEATQEDVRKLFEEFGVVASVLLVTEKKSDKSRGFGFVEMPDDSQAQAAIAALNGRDYQGRPLRVNVSIPKTDEEREEDRLKRKEAKELERRAGLALPAHRRAPSHPIGSGAALKHVSSHPAPGEQQPADEKPPWYKPASDRERKLRFKTGRRTLSYRKKQAEAGLPQVGPEKKWRTNPGAWRKKPRWEKKPGGEAKKPEWSGKPRWDKKPGGEAAKPEWSKKPRWDKKPGGEAAKPEWSKKPRWDKKPGGDAAKPEWSKKPRWDKKPGSEAAKPAWSKKPDWSKKPAQARPQARPWKKKEEGTARPWKGARETKPRRPR